MDDDDQEASSEGPPRPRTLLQDSTFDTLATTNTPAVTSAPGSGALITTPANLAHSGVGVVATRYQKSIIRLFDTVSVANVKYVQETLLVRFPRTARDDLVFNVDYWVPDDVGPPEDRFEFVAKVVVELQSQPEFELSSRGFPQRVNQAYADRVEEFFRGSGRAWLNELLQPAPVVSPRSVATPDVPSQSAVPEMVEITDGLPPYTPGDRTLPLNQRVAMRAIPSSPLPEHLSISIDPHGGLANTFDEDRTVFGPHGTRPGVVSTRLPILFWLSISVLVLLFWSLYS